MTPQTSPVGLEPGNRSYGTSTRRIRRLFAATLLFLLVAASGVVWLRYRRDMAAARARISTGSQVVNTPCGPIEYAVAGEGIPLLGIHGAGGGFDQGLEFFRPLISRGFKVIAPSRFGYLRTPMPADASPMAQADAHACLLDALGMHKVAVAGGSAGAPSAMQFCLRHAERCSAMVLMVPLAYREGAEPVTQKSSGSAGFLINAILSSDFMFWSMTHFAPGFTTKTILATPTEDVSKAPLEERARVAQILDHIEPISRRAQGLINDAAVAQSLPRYDLERYNVPTLAISVEDDLYQTYAGARYTADHVRGARFIGYPTGGHLWVGHQQEVFGEIERFLKAAPTTK
jgi:pimeloyl-ACP methyl ester carboxylesterase